MWLWFRLLTTNFQTQIASLHKLIFPCLTSFAGCSSTVWTILILRVDMFLELSYRGRLRLSGKGEGDLWTRGERRGEMGKISGEKHAEG